MNIEEIISQYTPYLINDKKCYEEKDVHSMLIKMFKQNSTVDYSELLNNSLVEQYPEATC